MNFSLQIPPIYTRLHARFGVEWNDGIAITYGDTVYSKNPIPVDVAEHEKVHVWQQSQIGVEEWWDRYINDPDFRLNQEVQAYKEQIRALNVLIKDRNQLYLAKRKLYRDLAGPMYDYMVSADYAKELLTV